MRLQGGVPLPAQRGSWLRTLLSWLGALGLLAGCLLFGIAVGFRANMRMYPKTTIIRHQPPAAATPAVGLGAPPSGLYGLMTSPKEYKDVSARACCMAGDVHVNAMVLLHRMKETLLVVTRDQLCIAELIVVHRAHAKLCFISQCLGCHASDHASGTLFAARLAS